MTLALPDIDSLIAPISESSPVGQDLRLSDSDMTISMIQEKRKDLPAALSPSGQAIVADWRGVFDLAKKALLGKTKDLQLLAWWTEARLQLGEGFPALREGIAAARALIERYWDGLHPGAEDGVVEFAIRARPLSWMGSSQDFLRAVRGCRIAAGASGRELCWDDYLESERVDELKMRSDQSEFKAAIEAGRLTSDQWRAALDAVSADELGSVLEQVRACLEEAKALEAACDERFQEDSPNLLELRQMLGDIVEYLDMRSAGAEASEAGGEESVEGTSAEAAPGGGASRGSAGPIQTRQEAFRRLQEISDFLRRTEPHSPVAYLVDRAVRWGEMTLEDVLQEIVKNPDVIRQIWDTFGLGAPQQQ
ncbi:MAG: type VI secretion system protein TssA [Planctomycetota bacterium]